MTTAEIPSGTLINNRYLIEKVLGKGGFGRTYKALDKQRFDFPCVLKEFVPSDTGTYALQKSRELFEQEAEVLSKLEHSQIPKFWGWFEENKRLFLVQEYVAGKTYHHLLDERLQQRNRFSEDEVIQLLINLLSVLDYIHKRQIIHRDISPDNIMLPDVTDRLPVLIDFGAVKQVLTQPQGNSIIGTTIGKAGYSPPEQQRLGKCSYSSDIYSLGVTAIVLLTGCNPTSLVNSNTLTWQWQSHVQVSSHLAEILDKMLASEPPNRYQSAAEVLNALLAILSNPTQVFSQHNTSLLTTLPVKWRIYALGTLSVVIISGAAFLVSPYIQPLCQSLNNCTAAEPKEQEFTQLYNQAINQLTTARTLASSAKRLPDLQDARKQMQNAVASLAKIPSAAKIYSEVQRVLPGYQSELSEMDKRLDEETIDQQLWDEAVDLATEGYNKNTEPASAKAFLKKAIDKLKQIPSTSLLANQVRTRLPDYQQKLKDLDVQGIATPTPTPPPTPTPTPTPTSTPTPTPTPTPEPPRTQPLSSKSNKIDIKPTTPPSSIKPNPSPSIWPSSTPHPSSPQKSPSLW